MRTVLNEVIRQRNLNTVHKDLQDIKDSLNHVHAIPEEAKKIANINKQEIADLKNDMQILKIQLHQEHEACIKLENYSGRSNLKFFGIPEKHNERDTNCEELI